MSRARASNSEPSRAQRKRHVAGVVFMPIRNGPTQWLNRTTQGRDPTRFCRPTSSRERVGFAYRQTSSRLHFAIRDRDIKELGPSPACASLLRSVAISIAGQYTKAKAVRRPRPADMWPGAGVQRTSVSPVDQRGRSDAIPSLWHPVRSRNPCLVRGRFISRSSAHIQPRASARDKVSCPSSLPDLFANSVGNYLPPTLLSPFFRQNYPHIRHRPYNQRRFGVEAFAVQRSFTHALDARHAEEAERKVGSQSCRSLPTRGVRRYSHDESGISRHASCIAPVPPRQSRALRCAGILPRHELRRQGRRKDGQCVGQFPVQNGQAIWCRLFSNIILSMR